MNRIKEFFPHGFMFFAFLGSKTMQYANITVVICLIAIFCNSPVKVFAIIPSETWAKSIDSSQMIGMGIEDNSLSGSIKLSEVKDSISKGIPKSRAVFSELDKPLHSKSPKDGNKCNDYGCRPSWDDYIYAILLGLIPTVFLCSIPIINELISTDRKT